MLLIANPKSGGSDAENLDNAARILAKREPVERVEPRSVEDFDDEVRAAASGQGIVVVAGGDGTFNRTVNALIDRRDDIVLGLIPMGTGNDLARTLRIADDPIEAAHALVAAEVSSIDVSHASGAGAERYFANACMGGFPVSVNEAIDDDTKKKLGPVAFIWGGVKALGDLERWSVTMDGTNVADCLAAGVGNGRTCGGGIEVWPDADPDDGKLDAYALPASNALETLKLGAKVRSGDHVKLDKVTSVRSSHIRVEAAPAMEFNVDGELVGLRTPVTFEVVGKLWMLRPGS